MRRSPASSRTRGRSRAGLLIRCLPEPNVALTRRMAGHGSRQPTIRRLHLLFRACGAKFDTLAAPRLAGGYTLTMSSLPASSRSKTSSLTVKLPESVVGLLGTSVEEAARHLVELAVIEVFRQGKLSGGKAAALLGLSRAAWLDLLAR